jgi:hypothetical protein
MKKFIINIIIIFLAIFSTTVTNAQEISGYVETEGRAFSSGSLYPEQKRNNFSLAAQLEFYHEFNYNSILTFTPFARYDLSDSRRNHFDIRELSYMLFGDTWEFKLGISKVFWGAAEFVHLVDIINQTDAVESISFEEKLGQPMVNISLFGNWGAIDLFVLPYFRERTFPGRNGRLRFPILIDTKNPRYESLAKERHVDFALRYSQTFGDWDAGLHYFRGTNREPALKLELIDNLEPVLVPLYKQINQIGLDLQGVMGEWLFKMEALYRQSKEDDFFAWVGGFEYTFVGVAGTEIDLGIIGQWAYDDRGKYAATPYNNDAIFGLRLSLNDHAGTELLAGFIQDLHSSARALNVEVSRRLGTNLRLALKTWAFLTFPEGDVMYSFRDDDFIQMKLTYYF